jgi:hypothetical protein
MWKSAGGAPQAAIGWDDKVVAHGRLFACRGHGAPMSMISPASPGPNARATSGSGDAAIQHAADDEEDRRRRHVAVCADSTASASCNGGLDQGRAKLARSRRCGGRRGGSPTMRYLHGADPGPRATRRPSRQLAHGAASGPSPRATSQSRGRRHASPSRTESRGRDASRRRSGQRRGPEPTPGTRPRRHRTGHWRSRPPRRGGIGSEWSRSQRNRAIHWPRGQTPRWRRILASRSQHHGSPCTRSWCVEQMGSGEVSG